MKSGLDPCGIPTTFTQNVINWICTHVTEGGLLRKRTPAEKGRKWKKYPWKKSSKLLLQWSNAVENFRERWYKFFEKGDQRPCPPVYRRRLLVVEESRAECHCLSPSSPVQSVVPFPSPVLVLVLSLHVILHKSFKYLVVLYSLISTDECHCLPPSQQRSVVTCPCPCALSSCDSSEVSQIYSAIALHQLIT